MYKFDYGSSNNDLIELSASLRRPSKELLESVSHFELTKLKPVYYSFPKRGTATSPSNWRQRFSTTLAASSLEEGEAAQTNYETFLSLNDEDDVANIPYMLINYMIISALPLGYCSQRYGLFKTVTCIVILSLVFMFSSSLHCKCQQALNCCSYTEVTEYVNVGGLYGKFSIQALFQLRSIIDLALFYSLLKTNLDRVYSYHHRIGAALFVCLIIVTLIPNQILCKLKVIYYTATLSLILCISICLIVASSKAEYSTFDTIDRDNKTFMLDTFVIIGVVSYSYSNGASIVPRVMNNKIYNSPDNETVDANNTSVLGSDQYCPSLLIIYGFLGTWNASICILGSIAFNRRNIIIDENILNTIVRDDYFVRMGVFVYALMIFVSLLKFVLSSAKYCYCLVQQIKSSRYAAEMNNSNTGVNDALSTRTLTFNKEGYMEEQKVSEGNYLMNDNANSSSNEDMMEEIEKFMIKLLFKIMIPIISYWITRIFPSYIQLMIINGSLTGIMLFIVIPFYHYLKLYHNNMGLLEIRLWYLMMIAGLLVGPVGAFALLIDRSVS